MSLHDYEYSEIQNQIESYSKTSHPTTSKEPVEYLMENKIAFCFI